uniref:Uncharacterized protein n=1 Tax=Rhizophora mucronata TaxID=61149 RepID=A0A2P2QUI2_RHIMU
MFEYFFPFFLAAKWIYIYICFDQFRES